MSPPEQSEVKNVSSSVSQPFSLAFLGPEGTFSHQAAEKYLSEPGLNCVSRQLLGSIPDVLCAVADGTVDRGLVPVENSIEGAVNVTLDMLAHEPFLSILAELVLDIEHHLMSYAAALNEINAIVSHPHALAQCRRFIRVAFGSSVKLLEAPSTAEAVRFLSKSKKETAAIGSLACHRKYGVPIISPNIGDYRPNQTRFFVVGRNHNRSELTQKTSLVFTLKEDRPGGLYEILGEFARHRINLTKIESRPAKKELGSYLFFIDCEAGYNNEGLREVLSVLSKKTATLKNLGSYNRIG